MWDDLKRLSHKEQQCILQKKKAKIFETEECGPGKNLFQVLEAQPAFHGAQILTLGLVGNVARGSTPQPNTTDPEMNKKLRKL